jgi:hypothetical protein
MVIMYLLELTPKSYELIPTRVSAGFVIRLPEARVKRFSNFPYLESVKQRPYFDIYFTIPTFKACLHYYNSIMMGGEQYIQIFVLRRLYSSFTI